MEVKEFVKSILKDITEAVDESNTNKHSFSIPDGVKDGFDFDLAIVLKKGTEGKIGAEIFTIVGAKAKGKLSEEIVNRIKFRVNVWTKR